MIVGSGEIRMKRKHQERERKHTHPVHLLYVSTRAHLSSRRSHATERKCLQSIKGRRGKGRRGAEGRRGGDRASSGGALLETGGSTGRARLT